ncbi:hypothetical protein BH09PLA1_BH09PLA1_05130 [soil metagenome]
MFESLETRTLFAAPVAYIDTPADQTQFVAGDTITFAGHGTDAEDGALPDTAFHWEVVFHHDDHTHPYIYGIDGVMDGSFQTAQLGEPSANIWYRLHLTVTDSDGMSDETFVDVVPKTVNLTLATSIAGPTLTLDNQPVTAPHTVAGVSGFVRNIGAETNRLIGGQWYQFAGWSDGGAANHNITTPLTDSTYTADYALDTAGPTIASSNFSYDAAPHQFAFTFDETLAGGLQPSAVVIKNVTTNQIVPASSIDLVYESTTRTATVMFPGFANGIAPNGRYRVTIAASAVVDPAGHHPAADLTTDFVFLLGDADNNGKVNFDDYARIDNGFNNHQYGFSNGDFDYNGVINFDDYSIIDLIFSTQGAPL